MCLYELGFDNQEKGLMTLAYRKEQDKRIWTCPYFFHITLGSEQKARGSAAQTLKKQKNTPKKP